MCKTEYCMSVGKYEFVGFCFVVCFLVYRKSWFVFFFNMHRDKLGVVILNLVIHALEAFYNW